MVTMTETADRKIVDLRQEEGKPDWGLRIRVVGGGCSGMSYELGWEEQQSEGDNEAAIAYDDILEAADRAALFKTAAKEICARHGVMASFMAKWNAELPGCSGHVHQSLWSLDGERNCFADPRGERGMSKAMRPSRAVWSGTGSGRPATTM